MGQVRKATRRAPERPAPVLVKVIKNHTCKINEDVLQLLERCRGNPSAIFESQNAQTQIGAVRDLGDLHQLGSHLFDKVDDFRRSVFCIIINDAHNIVNSSNLSTKERSSRTTVAIQRLAECFKADGVAAPASEVQRNLREWVACGATHQRYMCALGDGYFTVFPSGVSSKIM